jgi:hypothetical protein
MWIEWYQGLGEGLGQRVRLVGVGQRTVAEHTQLSIHATTQHS